MNFRKGRVLILLLSVVAASIVLPMALSQLVINLTRNYTCDVTSDTTLWNPGTHSFDMSCQGTVTADGLFTDEPFTVQGSAEITYSCVDGGFPPCEFDADISFSGSLTSSFFGAPLVLSGSCHGDFVVLPTNPGFIRSEEFRDLRCVIAYNPTWNIVTPSALVDFTLIDPEGKAFQFQVSAGSTLERLLIEIDKALVLDDRVDIGTPATLLFHARWAHNQTDIASTIQVNGTNYTTNSTGWVQFEFTSSEVGRSTFVATGAESGGITDFNQTALPASVIWDRVIVELDVEDSRIDVGSEASVSWTATYAYDGLPFNGTLTLNEPLSKGEVGLVEYTVASIDDPLYGLTGFTSNTVPVVFDTVQVTLSASRFDVGSEADILVDAVYTYDGQPLSGTVALNDTLMKDEVGEYGYTAASVTDELYGLTTFESNAVSVIFDRVLVTLSVADGRIDVGSSAEVAWTGTYEYDDAPFQGSVSLSNPLSRSDVGASTYTVASISDGLHGLTAFASNQVQVVFDRVDVTLGVSDSRVDVGSEAQITVDAVYAFDGQPFDGQVTLDNSLLQTEVGQYSYSAGVSGGVHEINAFTSTQVSIIFDRVEIELATDTDRVEVGSEASITWTATYAFDGAQFTETVVLNEETVQTALGPVSYSVSSVVDPLYGLTAFRSNEVTVIFDRVRQEVAVDTTDPDNPTVVVTLTYESDGAPVEGATVLIAGEPATPQGNGVYTLTLTPVQKETSVVVETQVGNFESISADVRVPARVPEEEVPPPEEAPPTEEAPPPAVDPALYVFIGLVVVVGLFLALWKRGLLPRGIAEVLDRLAEKRPSIPPFQAKH